MWRSIRLGEEENTVMDADKSYPIGKDQYVAPVAPPIMAPHQAGFQQQQQQQQDHQGKQGCVSLDEAHLII